MSATRIGTIHRIGLTLGLALSMSTMATLSSFAYSARARQMCMGDAFRLCSSEIPNIGRIVACMRRNKANLSQGCRAVMDQEDTAATKTKPAQAAPVEQKPATASHVERPMATATKSLQTAPVEQRPTAAPPVEQRAATETKPVQSAPVEQRPTAAPPVEQPAATETKPVQSAPVEQRPTAAPSVEQPAATERKSAQTAPLEQKPATTTPVEAKRVEARFASKGKPTRMTQRKHKHQQLTAGWHIHREFRNVERTIGFKLPIPLVIHFYW